MNGRLPTRQGNSEPHVVPHGCYRTLGGEAGAESWVVIVAENDAQWAGVAQAAGHPEWAEAGHSWSTIRGRMRSRTAIDAALAAYAGGGVAEDIAAAVSEAGGIAAPVIAHVGLLTSPQINHRGWLQPVDHRYAGTQTLPGFLWRVEPDSPARDRVCALVGEHNFEILAELGYSASEVESLLTEGALGDRYGVA
jgi:crotonobetainyl-CoA:carnitine CoA-transferase CaiB-like acyl-CoA transferase